MSRVNQVLAWLLVLLGAIVVVRTVVGGVGGGLGLLLGALLFLAGGLRLYLNRSMRRL